MKISIVTISYNSEKTIEKTIESVLTQQVEDLEYIIIDSASTDETLNIVNKYKDDRMKIISEKDRGISDAFNKGIKSATGELIGIINSDDVLLPGALQAVEEAFAKNSEIDVLHGNIIRFENWTGDGYEVKPCTDLEHMRCKFLLNHPATFVRKCAYDKFGLFDLDYKCAMDYELISKMYFGGAKFLYIDKPLAAFREGGVSDVKFSQTMKEHKKVAERNGANTLEIASYIGKLYLRRYALKIIKVVNLERFLRKHIKKQDMAN